MNTAVPCFFIFVSFHWKLFGEVLLQNACHGTHPIFPVSTLKMELFTTPDTQSVSMLLIIFVTLLKNAPAFAEAASRRQADAS